MVGKNLYKVYAPYGAKWVNWVRPVPFVAIDTYNIKLNNRWIDRKVLFLKEYKNDVAIFVDLPNEESVETGMALANLGYRPIPIFNGVNEQKGSQAIIESSIIESSLIIGGEKLKKIELDNNANPVFLLDSNRTNRYRANETIFDNSWDLYGQDIPSCEYFKNNGINKIVVVGSKIQRDLRKIFFKFQDNGFEFFLTNGYSIPQKIILKKTIKEKFEKEEL